MNQTVKINISLIVIFSLLTYPLFYYVYKYGSPYLGMIDFIDYYKLYSNMDIHGADSPLNMRLISSFCIYLMSKSGVYYDTSTHMDLSPFDKAIYFNAKLFNFICVVSTCVVIFHLLRKQNNPVVVSFLGGLIYLLGFGTLFFELMPCADALGVFLFAIILVMYNKKSRLVLIPLVMLILQREYLLLVTGLIALVDFVKFREVYYRNTFFYTIVCFAVYVILRKMIFETPRYAHHTNLEYVWRSMTALRVEVVPLIRQMAMTMNIFWIYCLILVYKRYKNLAIDRHQLIKVIFLLLQVLVLSFLLALGTNAGRYFYMVVPLVISALINELKVLKIYGALVNEK